VSSALRRPLDAQYVEREEREWDLPAPVQHPLTDELEVGLPSGPTATSSPSSTARTGSGARKPTCSVMFQPRRLRTRSGPSVETIARKPSQTRSVTERD
jgi:hypothetical protein